MKAIISDIHANLEALRAVLEHIESLGIRDIVCLGDVVGYGPDPVLCLDIVQRVCSLFILGNHEEAILNGIPANFSPRARRSLEWTRKVLLEEPRDPGEVRQARRKFMESFEVQKRVGGVTYVHGSPRDPTREYVLPRDGHDPDKMRELFALMEDYCFCGHSHTPGIFTLKDGFTHPDDLMGIYLLDHHEKALINVGSVGQPRDGNNQACYVTLDGETVVWRRVKYDVDATARKIRALPDLDTFLADRLKEGK